MPIFATYKCCKGVLVPPPQEDAPPQTAFLPLVNTALPFADTFGVDGGVACNSWIAQTLSFNVDNTFYSTINAPTSPYELCGSNLGMPACTVISTILPFTYISNILIAKPSATQTTFSFDSGTITNQSNNLAIIQWLATNSTKRWLFQDLAGLPLWWTASGFINLNITSATTFEVTVDTSNLIGGWQGDVDIDPCCKVSVGDTGLDVNLNKSTIQSVYDSTPIGAVAGSQSIDFTLFEVNGCDTTIDGVYDVTITRDVADCSGTAQAVTVVTMTFVNGVVTNVSGIDCGAPPVLLAPQQMGNKNDDTLFGNDPTAPTDGSVEFSYGYGADGINFTQTAWAIWDGTQTMNAYPAATLSNGDYVEFCLRYTGDALSQVCDIKRIPNVVVTEDTASGDYVKTLTNTAIDGGNPLFVRTDLTETVNITIDGILTTYYINYTDNVLSILDNTNTPTTLPNGVSIVRLTANEFQLVATKAFLSSGGSITIEEVGIHGYNIYSDGVQTTQALGAYAVYSVTNIQYDTFVDLDNDAIGLGCQGGVLVYPFSIDLIPRGSGVIQVNSDIDIINAYANLGLAVTVSGCQVALPIGETSMSIEIGQPCLPIQITIKDSGTNICAAPYGYRTNLSILDTSTPVGDIGGIETYYEVRDQLNNVVIPYTSIIPSGSPAGSSSGLLPDVLGTHRSMATHRVTDAYGCMKQRFAYNTVSMAVNPCITNSNIQLQTSLITDCGALGTCVVNLAKIIGPKYDRFQLEGFSGYSESELASQSITITNMTTGEGHSYTLLGNWGQVFYETAIDIAADFPNGFNSGDTIGIDAKVTFANGCTTTQVNGSAILP